MAFEKSVHRLAANLRARRRIQIIKRDATCLACLPDYPVQDFLDVAHITSLREFRRALEPLAATRHSFRPDNLVALCSACHAAQETGAVDGTSTLIPRAALKRWLDIQLQEHPGKTTAQLLNFPKRQSQVRALFDSRIATRGWNTVRDLVAKEQLGPILEDTSGPTFLPIQTELLPPEGQHAPNIALKTLEQCVTVAGGRVLRKGLASDFVAWYERQGTQKYLFSDRLDAPALIYQRPMEESLVGKIQRRFQLANLGIVRQLKVNDRLYLLQVHPV